MWWNRKSDDVEPGKEVSIHARLRSGETLEITFMQDRKPRQLKIEGRGELNLAIRSDADVTAELIGQKRFPAMRHVGRHGSGRHARRP